MITALTVNYNTPEHLERLLKSFRQFYDIPYLVIDGSSEAKYKKIKNFDKKYNIELIHIGYNIHHGPGMAYGISLINTDQILLVDSDVIVYKGGWLEKMEKSLRSDSYGTGDIQKEYIIKKQKQVSCPTCGYTNLQPRELKTWIDYLHPVLALLNRKVILKYAMPTKAGAPMIVAMEQIWRGNETNILQRSAWLTKDLWKHTGIYVRHNDNNQGMGTIRKTGSYNY